MARLSGNDISKWQGKPDYEVFKKNTHFVIAKASEGTGLKDPEFVRNQSEARRVGIPFGSYHFAKPSLGNSPEAEADWYLTAVGEIRKGELLALDYEDNWNGDVVSWCKRFLDRLASRLNGYKALIYLNESLTNGKDWTPVVSAGHGLWIAKYANPRSPDAAYRTGKWPFAAIYQWTSEQKVPGVLNGTGNVDGNVFYGDVVTFQKYGYQPSGGQPPAEEMITIRKAEYEALNKQISDLSGANKRLTDQLALKDKECQDKLAAQKAQHAEKIRNLAGNL